jgi:hypothetical protein
MTGTISQVVKPSNGQKQIRLLIYSTAATPTLPYGIGSWTLKNKANLESQQRG